MDPVLIIISDLHVGANDDFDIFRSDDKPRLFADFLTHVASRGSPVELVINGDFVDFLQLRPWNDLSRAAALGKIRQIVQGSVHVFADLGQFLRDPRHQLKVLLGNHDVELGYPEVWAEARQAILARAPDAAGRLEFFNTRTTYNPRVNGVTVHVEHGNAGDLWNEINYVPLFQDVETGTKTFAYPPGTKLVYETMNGFKESYRFVDLLKPEMPAVPLTLLALEPSTALSALPYIARQTLKSWANGLIAGLRRRLGGMAFPAPGSISVEHATEEAMAGCYARRGVAQSDLKEIEAFLSQQGPAMPPTVSFTPSSGNSIKLRLLVSALLTLNRFRAAQQGETFYAANHRDNTTARYAHQNWLKGDVKVVVFGHTHEALTATFPEGVYINGGAWANLVKLPSGADPSSLVNWFQGIADNTFERTSFPTFVRVASEGGGVSVGLNAWTETGERRLWGGSICP
jgi:UDP-2,3-diacylglucosamine pyrophosphatase LpxH